MWSLNNIIIIRNGDNRKKYIKIRKNNKFQTINNIHLLQARWRERRRNRDQQGGQQ